MILQKKAVRIINRKPFGYHTNQLFINNNILKIEDIYKYNVGKHMYKHWRDNGLWSTSQTSYNTRSRNVVVPQFQRLTSTQKSMKFIGPKIWNQIPNDIRQASSLEVFKRLYKAYLIHKYELL